MKDLRGKNDYSIEEIYAICGKDDKTSAVSFKVGSESYQSYGPYIIVVFLYTQFEREYLDTKNMDQSEQTSGFVRAKYLGKNLSKEKANSLSRDGIPSKDILNISYYVGSRNNTFHSAATRSLTSHEIELIKEPNGGDYDWIYGFNKRLVGEGIGLSPKERIFYLALKLYYEPEALTVQEKSEVYITDSTLNRDIDFQFLRIKYEKGEITEQEKDHLVSLIRLKDQSDIEILDKYLKEAGSSLKRLVKQDFNKATELFIQVSRFEERRINVRGKYPIFVDLESFLHIHSRHVKEFRVSKLFDNKDNFQWSQDDVYSVMKHVISSVEEEYQQFRETKPGLRFSKWGRDSIYFEGDYYTFHIEVNGRISTFHKNRKVVDRF